MIRPNPLLKSSPVRSSPPRIAQPPNRFGESESLNQPNRDLLLQQHARPPKWLEPISKSSEEDNEAGELDKAEEVLSVVLPADEDATLPLYPGEEALDEPAPLVTA